jgi:hypothetical protein
MNSPIKTIHCGPGGLADVRGAVLEDGTYLSTTDALTFTHTVNPQVKPHLDPYEPGFLAETGLHEAGGCAPPIHASADRGEAVGLPQGWKVEAMDAPADRILVTSASGAAVIVGPATWKQTITGHVLYELVKSLAATPPSPAESAEGFWRDRYERTAYQLYRARGHDSIRARECAQADLASRLHERDSIAGKLQDPELQKQLEAGVKRFHELPDWLTQCEQANAAPSGVSDAMVVTYSTAVAEHLG